jgi:primosomal protein N' (replication factor Y)
MRFRTAMHYPPSHWLISVVVRASTMVEAMATARRLADDTRRAGGETGVRVIGPAPAPLSRLRGNHRAQFFVKGTERHALRAAVKRAVASRTDLRRQVTIDVDPLSVL